MSRFFSNGTEGRAWQSFWCDRCANDHGMHQPEQDGGCEYMLYALTGDDDLLDGVWVDESEKFGFTMPPSIRCLKFTPCVECGETELRLNADGYPPPRRQQEFLITPSGPVLVTDNLLRAPKERES